MDIYLIRHTKVELENNTCYGQSDVELSNCFEDEVTKLKKKVNFSSEMIFFTSPLKRCLLLAKNLTKKPPIIDNRLLELNFGDWELKKWDSINQSELDNWSGNVINYICPNGESYLDLYNRSKEFFNDLIKENHKEVSIITHAGVIRSILSYILRIPLQCSFIIEIDYGKISKIKLNNIENLPFYNIEYINL
ncbi:MAG: alpha-ribazole phosphatase [Candidatus Lokiarchaeota archaeon]|nr:alpha-ribazole phosphatase [Candidatus Lokiarchaeota archaeon]